jgi:predicted ATPase/class 3 adenylate cyclase
VTEPPVGTITFFFTDLETSTRLWEQEPDAMRAALAEHDAMLRNAVESNGGYVVKSTGDGIHAAFDSAHAGVLAAVDAQRALLAHDWSEATGPLRVRMGLHSGEAELRDADYFGPAVNRAARIMAVAHPGQILCSGATAGLVDDEPLPGIELLDLGEHRLRDIARPDRLFQVSAAALPRDFPPLTTLDAAPGNLPPALSSFVGRDDDVSGIAAALHDARLVTLTGVGGVGKTRLALEVASSLRPEFPHGIWWCELAPVGDADGLIHVVAGALGIAAAPARSLEDGIVERLGPRDALVVLDNCEHLLDGAGRLATRILHECPKTRIIGTSREALGVDGERVWPLRSLAVPEPSAELAAIAASDAVRLFVDRMHAVRPTFVLEGGEAEAVGELCRRLDGIPLALELAAARGASMNPTEIAAHLDERFRLLTGGRRQSVERHRTLRATIDWSYSMLDPVEQIVFPRLAVFAGSFDAETAQGVVTGGGVEPWDVVDAIASLVAKSMVTTDDATSGTTRYRLLETMRQYAEDRLEEAGDADAWRRRLAQRYAELAEAVGTHLTTRDEIVWRRRLHAELDNLRGAVTWALDRDGDDRELALRIITALASEANASDSTGVTTWAERAIDAARASTPARRTGVLTAAAWGALNRGEIDLASSRVEEALAGGLPRDASAAAVPYVLLGFIRLIQGDVDAALAASRDGQHALAEVDLDTDASRVVLGTAAAGWLFYAGDVDAARALAEETVRLAREVGSATNLSLALFLQVVTFWRDDPERARPLLAEAIELVESGAASGPMYGLMLAVESRLCSLAGDVDGARVALRGAFTEIRRRADRPMLVTSLGYAIPTMRDLGAFEVAATIGGTTFEGPLAVLGNLPPPEDATARAALDQARQQLGDAAFADAWSRGAAMQLGDAVDSLLRALDDLPTSGH